MRARRVTRGEILIERGASAEDIRPPWEGDDALEFAFRLLRSANPIEAVAYFAYLLPRREAV